MNEVICLGFGMATPDTGVVVKWQCAFEEIAVWACGNCCMDLFTTGPWLMILTSDTDSSVI